MAQHAGRYRSAGDQAAWQESRHCRHGADHGRSVTDRSLRAGRCGAVRQTNIELLSVMNITPRPFVELTSSSAIRFSLKWQVVGLGILACHILLAKQSILLFPVMLLLVAWLYTNAPLAGLITYFQFLMYQNWMLGLLCTGMARNTFVMVQGSNFAILSV